MALGVMRSAAAAPPDKLRYLPKPSASMMTQHQKTQLGLRAGALGTKERIVTMLARTLEIDGFKTFENLAIDLVALHGGPRHERRRKEQSLRCDPPAFAAGN